MSASSSAQVQRSTNVPNEQGGQTHFAIRIEAADSIAVNAQLKFLFAFSAQKTRVKPQNDPTLLYPATSAWHFSYAPTAILKI
jgi:hypothetical protein